MIRSCIDCKFSFVPIDKLYPLASTGTLMCGHESCFSLVSGKYDGASCYTNRYYGRCGVGGIFFEARKSRKTLITRMIDWSKGKLPK